MARYTPEGQLIYKHLLIEYKKQESNNIDLGSTKK